MPDQGSVKMRPCCLKVTAKYLETSVGFTPSWTSTERAVFRLSVLSPGHFRQFYGNLEGGRPPFDTSLTLYALYSLGAQGEAQRFLPGRPCARQRSCPDVKGSITTEPSREARRR